MPCRGRADQTVANVKRLISTAGRVEWQLICMVDADPAVMGSLANADLPIWRMDTAQRGYWHAMQQGTDYWPEFTHFVNLANDLLPGRDWLARALAEYRCCFDHDDGLLGFNDGIHGYDLSPHFLISRGLLDRFGGWPVWYQHNYGDAELCERAKEAKRYSKAPWALLYHDHPITGGDPDSVYAEGMATNDQDARLFEERRRRGWPRI